jgi:hypothetical protein
MVVNCSNIDLKLFICPIIESSLDIFMLYNFYFKHIIGWFQTYYENHHTFLWMFSNHLLI